MRIGFVGYGRFGQALGRMLEERGHRVAAFDPAAAVPAEHRVATLAELAAAADLLFVAVPLAAMADTFRALEPLLEARHVVVDVGSVKLRPAKAMEETFGTRHAWVATHPLFGPVSLARAEQDLRVVVCPNPAHEEAVARVTALYESLGCTVIAMDAEAHDRTMAQTHALAFFVAKAILDLQVPTASEIAPPSFKAMVKTIDAVRADAGHLLSSLHTDNPFAHESRSQLLAALTAVDLKLNAALAEQAAEHGQGLEIAAPAQVVSELQETRDLIDELDRELVGLLTRRTQLAQRARKAKAGLGRGVTDPVREAQLMERRRAWAEAAGLDPEGVAEIFSSILRVSRQSQQRERTPDPAGDEPKA
jgi:prephenate dehydrogenase